jgi:S1-C subfamily serine protease
MRKNILLIVIATLSGYLGALIFNQTRQDDTPNFTYTSAVNNSASPQIVSMAPTERVVAMESSENFVRASQISTQSVVYIKNVSERVYRQSFMDMFFDMGSQTAQTISSGSGVIFSSDGYIVTNNHVIVDADRLEVILGKNSYDAKLIGTDPASDLAVLKIEAKDLPAIPIGSSRDLQVGEWVIAVGNPFNLTSTVTAGIVSAKARALNIVKDKFPIESFIQTDAAINPGNSGGALVNQNGELVGINTAILSRTGSYAGYGFAVPVDIVKKIVDDLINYGEVQKAFIGATVTDLDTDIAKRLSLNLSNMQGVLVTSVQNEWAADGIGVKENDVILTLDDTIVNSKAEFDELISYRSPGDKVMVGWKSGKNSHEKELVLTNRDGTTGILKTKIYSSEYLGADVEVVSKLELELFDIENGVKIVKLYSGGLLNRLDLEKGFIITAINQNKIDSAQGLVDVLSRSTGKVRIEGVSNSGRKGYYTFYLR